MIVGKRLSEKNLMLVWRRAIAPSLSPNAPESLPYFGSPLTTCAYPAEENNGIRLSGLACSCSQNIIFSPGPNSGAGGPGSTTPYHLFGAIWLVLEAWSGTGAFGKGLAS